MLCTPPSERRPIRCSADPLSRAARVAARNAGFSEEIPRPDGAVDPGDLLVDHASSADVHVPDLGIPHLSGRKPHALLRGVDQGSGEPRPEPVEERRVGEGHRVPFLLLAMAPAVQDDQRDERAIHVRDYRILPARRTVPCPSSSSIRRSWLYFAIRSVRRAEPVLICPAFIATARSAMNVSSVSPDRWEITGLPGALRHLDRLAASRSRCRSGSA